MGVRTYVPEYPQLYPQLYLQPHFLDETRTIFTTPPLGLTLPKQGAATAI